MNSTRGCRNLLSVLAKKNLRFSDKLTHGAAHRPPKLLSISPPSLCASEALSSINLQPPTAHRTISP
ncbi:MAG: hypothetical protein ACLUEQ_04865 [Cloacibacillus evryensis]